MSERHPNQHEFTKEQRRALARVDPELRALISPAWQTMADTAEQDPHFPAEWLEGHDGSR